MAVDINDIEPWNQYPNESAAAFRAFNLYKRLPPQQRTVNAAWRMFNPEQAQLNPNAQGGFSRWSKKFRWKERADAYDRHMEAVRDTSEVRAVKKEREEARKRRRAALNVLGNFVNQYALTLEDDMNKKKLQPQQVRALATIIATFTDISRREYETDGDDESEQAGLDINTAAKGLRSKIQQELAKAAESGEPAKVSDLLQ